MKLHLEIITQEKHLLTAEVDQLTAPSISGEVTILPNHIPLFTKLNDGVLIFKQGSDYYEYAVVGGFMDVAPNNNITVLADSAIRSADINILKVTEAKKKAEEAMQNKVSEVEFKQAESSLRKAILELKVAKKRSPKKINL